jgi:hypothetical protein
MSAWILKNTSALLKNIKLNCIICQSFVKYADVGNVTVIALKNNFLEGDAAALAMQNTTN